MKRLLSALLLSGCLFAETPIAEAPINTEPYKAIGLPPPPPTPWFTGPLIAPVGAVVPFGHFEVQSYLFFTTNTGTYSRHWHSEPTHTMFSFNPQLRCYFGLSDWMDLTILPEFFSNTSRGKTSVRFGDLPIGFDFQIIQPDATWFPGLKFTVQEIFPTGHYDHLNPKNYLTDSTGLGSFGTNFNLLLYQVIHLQDVHYMTFTFSAGYTLNLPVNVEGYNAYGGGHGTNGKIVGGNQFQAILSFELSLSQNWALALDNVYTHMDATTFYGDPGTTSNGDPATVGLPSSEQLSFAPAFEYNFSEALGLCVGCWFTAMGRNSTQFRSGVINLDYTY